MMRTPAKKVFARSVTQIEKTPPLEEKWSRHGFLRASSVDQISSILYNRSMSPRLHPNPSEGKENVAPDLLRVLPKKTKLMNETNNNDTLVKTKLMVETNNNDTLVNQAEPSTDFCEVFVGWLKKTEIEVDTATFARLKGDLCQLVGKFTLDFSKKQN